MMENRLELKITSPMPPSVNHYTGVRTIMKNGKPVSIVYETKEAKDYKCKFLKIIHDEVKKQNWNISLNKTQHFYVDAVFYFDRIDKDSSNYDKCLLDTITESKTVWYDDNIVLFRPQRIYYDPENSRIELTIYPVEYVGVFDDIEQLEIFEKRCSTCMRYKRNCSILKKAKEGRIQKEVRDLVCEKYKEQKE